MNGVHYSSLTPYHREASQDYASPTNDNIPIDPALEPVLSGAGYYARVNGGGIGEGHELVSAQFARQAEVSTRRVAVTSKEFGRAHDVLQPLSNYSILSPPTATFPISSSRYSQGPQGDPFAPPPPVYPEPEPEAVSPSKSVKKKRRHKRGESCEECHGDEAANKEGKLEPMLICEGCGRCWHPSCLNLGKAVQSESWRCSDCKSCEVCHTEGNDDKMILCDNCDRGWHTSCLTPPLDEPPSGTWHCPKCPPIELKAPHAPSPEELSIDIDDERSLRGQSVASTSRSVAEPFGGNSISAASAATDESDMDVDDADVPRSTKQSKKKVIKPKARARPRADTVSTYASSPAVQRKPRARVRAPSPPPARRVTVRLRIPGKGKQREDDEDARRGLFDDILSVEHRDTTKTAVDNGDKQKFENSRRLAERRLNPPRQPDLDSMDTLSVGPSSRPLRSHLQPRPSFTPSLDLATSPSPSTPGGMFGKGKTTARPSDPAQLRIQTIRFGEFDIRTWYDAPFPEEYNNLPEGRLWICEFCLKYMKSGFMSVRHRMKCKSRHPPGDEIYRDGDISVFEIDGRKNKIYCQNLCLLSKMFLDHKSLFYDVEPFLFYVMTETNDLGARFIGYFSKEKRSPKDYNVSCIMTLPVRQRRGWGNLLIDFSYLLSKKEHRSGSPEKPLSALGALSYQKYWTLAVKRYLLTAPDHPTIEDISTATSMTLDDVCFTLKSLGMLYVEEAAALPLKPAPGQSIKFPKGRKHGLARRHLHRTQTADNASAAGDDHSEKGDTPFVPPKAYTIRFDRGALATWLSDWETKNHARLRPEKLRWSPFLIARIPKTDGVEALPLVNGVASAAEQANGVLVVNGASIAKRDTPASDQANDSAVAESPRMDMDIVGTPFPTEKEVKEENIETQDNATLATPIAGEETNAAVPQRLRSTSRAASTTPARALVPELKRAGSVALSGQGSPTKRRRTGAGSFTNPEEGSLPAPYRNGRTKDDANRLSPDREERRSDETIVAANEASIAKAQAEDEPLMDVDHDRADEPAQGSVRGGVEEEGEDNDAEGEIDDEYHHS